MSRPRRVFHINLVIIGEEKYFGISKATERSSFTEIFIYTVACIQVYSVSILLQIFNSGCIPRFLNEFSSASPRMIAK